MFIIYQISMQTASNKVHLICHSINVKLVQESMYKFNTNASEIELAETIPAGGKRTGRHKSVIIIL